MLWEVLHHLIERSGMSAKEFAIFAGGLAYVWTGAAVAMGVQTYGLRPSHARLIIAAILMLGVSLGLHLFPEHPGPVVFVAVLPAVMYVYTRQRSDEIPRL